MKCAYCNNEHGVMGDVVCPVRRFYVPMVYEDWNGPVFAMDVHFVDQKIGSYTPAFNGAHYITDVYKQPYKEIGIRLNPKKIKRLEIPKENKSKPGPKRSRFTRCYRTRKNKLTFLTEICLLRGLIKPPDIFDGRQPMVIQPTDTPGYLYTDKLYDERRDQTNLHEYTYDQATAKLRAIIANPKP